MSFPFASVPGDIPIGVPFLLKGSHVRETRRVRDPDWDPALDPKPTYISVTHERPVHGGMSFGCITTSATYDGYVESVSYILEDGSQFRDRDFTNYAPGGSLLAPAQFGLASKSWSQVKTHVSTRLITYSATAADLGTWSSAAAALAPVGFTAGLSGYKVIMDKDRARIYAYASELQAWVPILWLDRFGHSASFQWTRTTGGDLTVFSVKALNQAAGQPDRGVQVQWAVAVASSETEQVLLRADYIGLQAPSIQVSGYSGFTDLLPSSLTGYLDAITPPQAGPVLRPTRIDSGSPAALPAPAWLAYGLPLPPSSGSDPWAPVLTWRFAYDANKAELASFTDALGATTTFTYANLTLYDGAPSNYNQVRGVSATSTTDGATGATFNRTWTRVLPVFVSPSWTSTTWKTSLTQRFSSGDATEVPTQEWVFSSPGQAVAYGNGALLSERLYGPSKTYVSQVHVPGTYGINASLSDDLGPSVSVDGQPTRSTTVTRDTYGLPQTESLSVGGQTWQTVAYTYTRNIGLLDPGSLATVATKRLVGGALVDAPTRNFSYTADGLLELDYFSNGGLQRGQRFGYDSEGHLTLVSTYPSGTPSLSTSYSPDPDGRPLSATTTFSTPNGGISSYSQAWTYSPAGRVLTATDGRGVRTTTGYDSRGRVRTVSAGGSPTVTYTYPSEFRRDWSSNGGGSGSETLDAFGRLRTRTLPGNLTETAQFDMLGRTTVLTQVAGGTSRKTYGTFDPLGRVLTSSSYASPLSQTLSYTADGTSAKVTTSLSNGVARSVWTDPLGQTVKAVDPWSTVTTAYNALGLPTQVAQVAGGVTQTRSFDYDPLGSLTSRTEPEVGTTTYSGFDDLGNPTAVNDGNRTRTLAFDGLGRLRSVIGGSESSSFVFDGLLLKRSSTFSNGQTVSQAFTYKAASSGARLDSETLTLGGGTQTTGYGYDTYGRLTALTYPSGRKATYGYDSLGRVNLVNQVPPGSATPEKVADVTYDTWGNRNKVAFASGARSEWVSTLTGASLDSWTVTPYGAAAEVSDYGNDANGNLNKGGGWTSLTHDTAGRLTAASGFGESVALSHDGFGNNTSSVASPLPSGGNNFTFSAMADNKVPLQTSTPVAAPTGWSYRTNGEASQFGSVTGAPTIVSLQWDGLGRLMTAASNGTTWTNTYASSGLRVQFTDSAAGANSRFYAYAPGGLLLGEYDGARAWKRDVIYLGGEAIAEIDGSATHELHNDHLGSPRVITARATGAVEGRQAFGPYGEALPTYSTGYLPLTGYTGHLQPDPSGLTYMRGRFYSAAWHRFVNSDQGADPRSFNQMAYVGGSPLQATDPSGMTSEGAGIPTIWGLLETVGYSNWGGIYLALNDSWSMMPPPANGSMASGGTATPQTPKNRDEDACAAYRALVAKYGGIPTGRNEAGAELYRAGNSFGFTDPIFQTARAGRNPSASGLLNSPIPSGAVRIGYIHTHPEWVSSYSDGSSIPKNLQLGLQASGGDYQALNDINTPLGISQLAGYVTTPGLWSNGQIIRFGYVTINGKEFSQSQLVNCR